ncbi:MAG: hypothetical protein M1482_04025 [Chloroflexi bacterium]|nr:hypothetical protein [Chloroflexota bacterium]
MIVVALVVALSSLGWVATGALSSDLDPLERFGLAYGIGSGILTLGVFLGAVFGVAIILPSVAAIYLLLLLAAAWLLRRRGGLLVPSVRVLRFDLAQFVIAGSIALVLAVSFAAAAYWPPYMWDSLAVWALKGKVIAARRRFRRSRDAEIGNTDRTQAFRLLA